MWGTKKRQQEPSSVYMGFAYQHELCDEVAEARVRGGGVKLSLK